MIRVFARVVFVWMILMLTANVLFAQDIFKIRDLSKVNVDAMSDEEIIRYRDQARASGLSDAAAEQFAIQKGLPSSELLKLNARISKIDNTAKIATSGNAPAMARRGYDTSLNQRPALEGGVASSKIFGNNLFANSQISFEPNLRIATPKNYILGPDDELLIDVFGYQEVNYRLTISPEGSITIPYVGVIPVSGSSIEQATRRIRDRMIRNGYASLGSGQSKIEVNVGKIKSIKVTIVGEAKRPGTYTLSSLSSIFNALYAAGGINDKGSFRNITLIRGNNIITKLDAYDFLLRGDLSKNIGLSDQDVIRVPVADVQVEVTGEVKRPGIFEMLPSENMNDLIRFTGGFTNQAYTSALHIQQLNEKERQLKDIAKVDFGNYTPRSGDFVIVDKVLETFTNRVTVKGAVLRPGQFELTPGLKLSDLIKKAEGLREDAFTNRALLVRRKADLTTEVIPFEVRQVLNDPSYDITLQKEDVVSIASVFEYKDNYTITIEGEVRNPGVYQFFDNITLKDLLFQAGGLTDAASPQQIEIARRINSDSVSFSEKIANVLNVTSEKDLVTKGAEIQLSPFDIVLVRAKINYRPQITVRLEGEIMYPGTYVLETKKDRVSDLIKRAGGLTPEAFMQGAYLSRINSSGIAREANISRIQKIQQDVKDTANNLLNDATNPIVKVGLDLEKITSSPGDNEDIVLREGDVLNVSKKTNEVMVNGEVMFPTQVVYKEGESLDYYISKAGGFTDNARKKKTYVLYANGNAAKTKKFLFFKNYPPIKAGAEVLVPKQVDRSRQRFSTAEILGISTALATLLTVVVTLVRL